MASHGSDVAAGRHAACAGDAQRKDERHTESEALHQLKWEWHPRGRQRVRRKAERARCGRVSRVA
eukprot:scaffold45414_cov71-Phaeocystis_antarctica.AAC.2